MKTSENSDYYIPGRKPVLELLQARPERIDTIFIAAEHGGLGDVVNLCKERAVRFRILPRNELNRIYTGNHQGVIVRLRERSFTDLADLLLQAKEAPLPLLLALDQIHDPGNMGTLARTLASFGGAGLLFPKDRTAFLGPAASKAAAGALDALSLCQVVNLARALDTCAEAGFTIYGAGSEQKNPSLYDTSFQTPAVLILGNEDKGIRPNVRKRCDALLRIPMHQGRDSLNVAQAGAVIMGEFLRNSLSV